jgi:hypothetical protein
MEPNDIPEKSLETVHNQRHDLKTEEQLGTIKRCDGVNGEIYFLPKLQHEHIMFRFYLLLSLSLISA